MKRLRHRCKLGRPIVKNVDAPIIPAKEKSLWVLERADAILGEVGTAIWLTMASIWRVPKALIAEDSITRLKKLVHDRKILPPRINLLVASLTSTLFVALVIPERTPHAEFSEVLSSTSSPEALLAAVASPLLSLWVTVILIGHMLGRMAGVNSNEPTTVLIQAISSMTILSCLGMLGISMAEEWKLLWKLLHFEDSATKSRLADVMIATGFSLMILYLAGSGVRWAQQTCDSSRCSQDRMSLLLLMGLLSFILSAFIAMILNYNLAVSRVKCNGC